VLQTTQQLAQLSFLAVSNSSAFVPLWVDDITNSQVNGQSVWRTLPGANRVAIIGETPLVEPLPKTNGYHNLVIYGVPGTEYEVVGSPVIWPTAVWQPIWLGTMPTNMWMPALGLTNTESNMIFRVRTHAD